MNGEVVDVNAIERALLRIEENLASNEKECDVQLDVADCGSWIIKFRKSGVIVNNRLLIFSDCADISAKIKFISHNTFWTIIQSHNNFSNCKFKGLISCTGSEISLKLLENKLIKLNKNQMNPTTGKNSIQFGINGDKSKTISGNSRDDSHVPLKSGWLLKQRSLIRGWRCRFFVVYPGRLEYFVNQHDRFPRGVIPLYGAEVNIAKKASVNGVSDHWSVTVEPHSRYKEKSFRFASELTGVEGSSEANNWITIFRNASNSLEKTGIYSTGEIEKPLQNANNISTIVQDKSKEFLKLTTSNLNSLTIKKTFKKISQGIKSIGTSQLGTKSILPYTGSKFIYLLWIILFIGVLLIIWIMDWRLRDVAGTLLGLLIGGSVVGLTSITLSATSQKKDLNSSDDESCNSDSSEEE